MSPLRILLGTEPSGGGSGRHVVDLASALCALGHEVSVIYSSTRAEQRFVSELKLLPLKSVIDVPMRRAVGPWDVPAAIRVAKAVRSLGPLDVIHSHSSKAGALLRLIPHGRAVSVYTPHAFRTMDPNVSPPAKAVYKGIESFLARSFTDAVIAVSPEEASHALNLGVPVNRLHTVINGVTPAPLVDRSKVRAELGLSEDDVAIAFVGRLCEQKDPVRFAEAVRIAHEINPRIRGIVLGDGELESATRTSGSAAVKLFSGRNARLILPACDIFVMSSRYEAMPYVLLEALQAGLPIISTQVGGASTAVEDGENGALLPADVSSADIAQIILSITSSDRRGEMAKFSTNRAKAFSASNMARNTVEVYRSAISEAQLGRVK